PPSPRPRLSPLSLHDALPIYGRRRLRCRCRRRRDDLGGFLAHVVADQPPEQASRYGPARGASGGLGSVPVPALAHSESTAGATQDRKSTRLNSSHQITSYAVF